MYDVNYDVNYFIDKFENIPENKWCVGHFTSYSGYTAVQHCAMGHCGVSNLTPYNDKPEALSLVKLCAKYGYSIVNVNDGGTFGKISTPKGRVLAMLYKIRELQSPPPELQPFPESEKIANFKLAKQLI